MQLKHSKQRDSILEFLAARKDHPTADVVYMNVREQLPNISLGTVYRNLTLLSDLGEILRLVTERIILMLILPHIIILCVRNVEVSSISRWRTLIISTKQLLRILMALFRDTPLIFMEYVGIVPGTKRLNIDFM